MKKIFFLLAFCLSFTFSAFADPWDCMTKEQATELAAWLKKNPFVIDYCDCCRESAIESEGSSDIKALFLYVSSATVVPCEYDAEQFSVQITYAMLADYEIEGDNELGAMQLGSEEELMTGLISLNYHFSSTDNTNLRIYEALQWTDFEEIDCKRLNGLPKSSDFKGAMAKKYQKWYSSRGND